MAPTSKKKGAALAASASKSSVPPMTRAEKSAVNKAVFAEVFKQANRDIHTEIALRSQVPLGPPLKRLPKRGAPYAYTEVLGQTFYELVSTGHSLDRIAEREDMPSLGAILEWIANPDHPFYAFYAKGKKQLVPLFEERMALAGIEIEPMTIITRRQGMTATGPIDVTEERVIDNTARSQLRMNAYQITLAHLMPKKHGRQPDGDAGKANAQLEGLFNALKAGPSNG